MYLDSVFWFLSLPIIIIASYQISKVLIKRYESEKGETSKEQETATE